MNKTMLIILDGWGIGKEDSSNAIYNANTPYWDSLTKNYPNSFLRSYGEFVGLPEGQMGNSEVGHLNIGAGRVIYQDLVRINLAIKNNQLSKNATLIDAYDYAKKNNKNVNLIGLLSDGGVHSSEKHLYNLCDIAKECGLEKVFIHALMDGRDCDPRSGIGFMEDLQNYLKNSAGQVATICGRYYTMDRDKRWERVKVGYDLLVSSIGEQFNNPIDAIRNSYNREITDEFIKPIVIVDQDNTPLAKINEDDVVICFNYRTDRLREITTALTQDNFPDYGMKTIPLKYITMTVYSESFKGIDVLFDKQNVSMTLGEYLSSLNCKQLRIAETEKYPHVTFFFSGGQEKPFEGEDRILVNSPKVATYDLQPEMSAYLVTDKVIEALNSQKYDFICLNYANGDMVGHTGVFEKIILACEAVDKSLSQTVETAKQNGYDVVIIADHGNAEYAINDDGTPNTAHSVGNVPIIYVGERFKNIKDGVLADVAPTICRIMGIDVPSEMEGAIVIS